MDDASRALLEATERVVPRWVERSILQLAEAWRGAVDERLAADAAAAGREAGVEVSAELRRLLSADIDDQWTTPLTILRHAVRHPTDVLQRAGVPPVERDAFREERFPDDIYDLAPATFADVDPELHQLGLVWGAAKARAHLGRRGRPGRSR